MNLRTYYQQIRMVEDEIQEPWVVLVSMATPEGGSEGSMTEVSKSLAARMIVDQKARIATKDEVRAFRQFQREAQRRALERETAGRIQLTVLNTSDLKTVEKAGKSQPGEPAKD
jgi:hypothetical protein